MIRFLKNSIVELDLAARKSAKYSESYFTTIGWLSWLLPVAGIVDQVVAHPTYGTYLVRTSAAIICIPLIFWRRLPSVLAKNLHIYFVCVTAYCLPFTFGLMLSMNAATTPVGNEIHMFWILQYFIALFLFIQLIVSGTLATVLWLLTSVAALLPALVYPDANISELKRVFVYPITGYLTALGFGILTYRKTAIIDSEKTAAASAIGANLAHELRTPLASIGAMAKGVTNLLPVLTDAYRKAKNADIQVQPLRETQLERLNNILNSIRNEVEYSNTIIDMLLVNTADKSLSDVDKDTFSVREAVEEAVQRYPFNNDRERELISIDIPEDIQINAPRLLVIHVLFNLMKNALHFVQKAGKGTITISAVQNDQETRLIVHDTGMGIPAAHLSHIFERFYTTTHTGQGAGIGLSFCRLVMEAIGGIIECDSREGEYSTFILRFPLT